MKYNLRTRKVANYNVNKRFNQDDTNQSDLTSKTKGYSSNPTVFEIKKLLDLVKITCYPQKVNVVLDCFEASVLFIRQHPDDKSCDKFARTTVKKIVECLVHPEYEHEKKTLQDLINQIL